jgi:hypothetical protein
MTSSNSIIADRRNPKTGGASGKSTRGSLGTPAAPKRTRASQPPILPGEDARAYRRRLKAWMDSLGPRNAVEQYLVERAVVFSWQLDRVDRAQIAQLSPPADEGRSEPASGARPLPMTWPSFDDSESAERLRRYQLAYGRALFQTLQTLSGFRRTGEVAGSGMGYGLDAERTPVPDDRRTGGDGRDVPGDGPVEGGGHADRRPDPRSVVGDARGSVGRAEPVRAPSSSSPGECAAPTDRVVRDARSRPGPDRIRRPQGPAGLSGPPGARAPGRPLPGASTRRGL